MAAVTIGVAGVVVLSGAVTKKQKHEISTAMIRTMSVANQITKSQKL